MCLSPIPIFLLADVSWAHHRTMKKEERRHILDWKDTDKETWSSQTRRIQLPLHSFCRERNDCLMHSWTVHFSLFCKASCMYMCVSVYIYIYMNDSCNVYRINSARHLLLCVPWAEKDFFIDVYLWSICWQGTIPLNLTPHPQKQTSTLLFGKYMLPESCNKLLSLYPLSLSIRFSGNLYSHSSYKYSLDFAF